MRALIVTVGSEGDIQPFLALGKRLLAEGHDVTFSASDSYAARTDAVGVPFVGRPTWSKTEFQANYIRVINEKNKLRQLTVMLEFLAQEQHASVPELMALAPEADIVVHSPLSIAAAAAARAVGTPHVSVHHTWPLHRARGYGPTNVNLGPAGNALAWSIVGSGVRRATDKLLNPIVVAAGLPPWRDVLFDASHSRLLNFIAISPHILKHDPLFDSTYRTTGYWFLDEPEYVPPDDLAAFIADEPPIVIGFGSNTGFDARAVTKQLLEAVRGLGRRVVLQSGWAGLGDQELPPNIFLADFVPHGWLYARAACVVHHGGAGTTAAAFRAGIPQAVVWLQGDQLHWGRKIAQLGVGPPPRPHRALNTGWLRGTLDRLLTDNGMATRARALGIAIREEDGVGMAVRAIEEVSVAT
ncbi:glycosyltransferase [Streptosporangium sp. NBC_01755]|uniref:glycosyltransferase n=1 Tax=unclassified Streptosporangium TaxID=2632669 RepID=UPI002DD7EE13|nr:MULTISPECIES: glycosyltransferase [unclassified Streptosporangium]WSA29354.1 glycosyltransferase [Streptosporangium sp. NBC_01810]WSC99203.1 glycosyltransferase [Streptosporangium sp. NBC_01755]